MPTAVVSLDASALPELVRLSPHYEQALVVVTWRGRPVGHGMIPVAVGVIEGERLRDGVERIAGDAIAARTLDEWLAWDERPPLGSLRATVAICTRDRVDDLERCLAAIALLPDDGQEVLVVDSASRDGAAVRAAVERHAGACNVRYVRAERGGLDIARNCALREATGDVVAFCDDDAEVDSGWLRAIVANFTNPRILCVTGLVLPRELETPAQEWFESTNGFARGYARRMHDGVEHDPFFVARVGVGASMALRRDVLELLGPFDDALDAGTRTCSGGDHDYFTRILAEGYCIVYEPAALSWHRHRRDWTALCSTIEGYGTGVWAYLTRQLLEGEMRAPYVALAWLQWQLRGIVRAMLGRPSPLPFELAVAELRGCFAGPRAYLAARRAARAHASRA